MLELWRACPYATVRSPSLASVWAWRAKRLDDDQCCQVPIALFEEGDEA